VLQNRGHKEDLLQNIRNNECFYRSRLTSIQTVLWQLKRATKNVAQFS
jgi:hypothetical protein